MEEKVISMATMAELSKILATTEEVDEKIAKTVADCANIVCATTEEVLALFKRNPPETTGGGDDSGGDTPGGEV